MAGPTEFCILAVMPISGAESRAALFRLGRALRYRPLPIIGVRVRIESLADVEPTLRRLTAPWGGDQLAWDGCDIALGLAKYGLLDRWCTVDPEQLDAPSVLRGVAALRQNGFVKREPEPDPDQEREMREWEAACLIDLAERLEGCLLKIFLHDEIPADTRFPPGGPVSLAAMTRLSPTYFPETFVVTDACLTNASTIWLSKHFYL